MYNAINRPPSCPLLEVLLLVPAYYSTCISTGEDAWEPAKVLLACDGYGYHESRAERYNVIYTIHNNTYNYTAVGLTPYNITLHIVHVALNLGSYGLISGLFL